MIESLWGYFLIPNWRNIIKQTSLTKVETRGKFQFDTPNKTIIQIESLADNSQM